MEMHTHKGLVIIGTGSFAKLMLYYLRTYTEHTIVAFSVNKAYISEQSIFEGLPVIPLEDLHTLYPPESYDVILGVGYTRMNTVRRNLFRYCKQAGYQIQSFVHPSAYIEPSVSLGEGNIILEQCTIAAFTQLGDGNLLFSNVMLGHDGTIGSFNTFSVGASVAGMTQINTCCYIGTGCTVFDHLHIEDYSLCGAGAVISKDTAQYSVTAHARSVTLDKRSIDIW